MESRSRLIEVTAPADAEGAVLLLHGGYSRRERMVRTRQLSVIRMIPIARRIAAAGAGRLAVFRLLNSTRGWDEKHSPVDDARWALGQIAMRPGGRLPTCLVGHSLGGRAAILGVTLPGVRSAAAMAPWVYADDVPPGLDGQEILIVHGSRDRIASPQRSAALAETLALHTPVRYLQIEGGRHAMLGQHDAFTKPVADFAVETLLGPPAPRGES